VAVKRAASRRLVALALAMALSASAQAPQDGDGAARPHHTSAGFRNNYIAQVDKPLGDFLRWRYQAWRDNLPPPPRQPTPVAAPELARLQGNAAAYRAGATGAVPSVTWIGHATALIQAGGLSVLTDPIFSERASPLRFVGPRRAQPPGIALDQLPPIDVVLISHNHYDHLDLDSLERLNEHSNGATLFLVPMGNRKLLREHGIQNVIELNWWEAHTVRGVQFHLTPVQHWSGRGIGDRNQSLWGGWAVFARDLHWFFAGDSGYSRDFADIGTRFASRNGDRGFDLALLPIGAYEPRWFMREQHVDPAEAAQAHRDLGARQSLGIHWGTFELTDEPLDQPPRDLQAARAAAGLADDEFFLLAIGQSRWLPPRNQGTGAEPGARP
jgi:N-acyl-phosphatidylethanolamine-hydrolysing phospholipase D